MRLIIVYRKDLIMMMLNVLMVVLILQCLRYQQPSSPVLDLKPLHAHVTTIEEHLTTLQQQAHQLLTSTLDQRVINESFNKLTTLLEQIKTASNPTILLSMQDTQQALSHKLDVIEQVTKGLNKKASPITYRPPSALPFQVISIDTVQQVNVASVTYHFKTIPLEQGDHLAGWRVIRIDFARQCLEFANEQHERVMVKLNKDNVHD